MTDTFSNPPQKNWHTLEENVVAATLNADLSAGLDQAEASLRLAQYGLNQLAEKPPTNLWKLFLDQFKGFLILVLIGAALLAGAIGDLKDAIVILVVVMINALLGFYQEYRAEQSLAALKKMLAPEAEVRRNGKSRIVPATELIPGDLVLLSAGDRIPADGRIVQAHTLEVDESSLTGESRTVGKQSERLEGDDRPLAERDNMLYMNTSITRGRAELLITATGMQTEMGRVASLLSSAQEAPTPLQIQLDGLGKRLALIAGVVVMIMLISGLLRGEPWAEMLMTAIALAVAAIPEGLPAVVTVTLALGLHRMARHQAIVKRLAAVETLGCTSVICTDKTGTLTVNQMTARSLYSHGRVFSVSGEGYEISGEISADDDDAMPDLQPLLIPLMQCNNAHLRKDKVVGDPMEGALLVVAAKYGLDREAQIQRHPRIAEIPFDTAHKFMASFHLDGDQLQVLVKGAPDVLLEQCSRVLGAKSETPLTTTNREAIESANEALASDGLRVLAAARGQVSAEDFDPAGKLFNHIDQLTFTGLVGLMDPPRAEVREAISHCHHAGIQVKMITGDQNITATAIARELGIEGKVLNGADLRELDERSLAACIEDVDIFARVTPEQKVQIVQSLKARGQVVAMTGDGVNDAPALKSADIGIAMGINGTDVTREAATMVLTDDNFTTIVHAVEEGRAIYDNIVKFVRFQLSTNIGAILTVFSAPFLGLPLPFNPIQILWVNIIMDGPPAMALGVDPGRPGLMNQPPRAIDERILTLNRLGNLASYGATMAIGTLAVLYYGLQTEPSGRAVTLAFTTFVLFQVFNAFNARADQGSTFNRTFFHNRWLWLALIAVVGLQILAVHWAILQPIFHTQPLSLSDWMIATFVASSVLVLDEARKLGQRILGRTTAT